MQRYNNMSKSRTSMAFTGRLEKTAVLVFVQLLRWQRL